MLDYPNQIKVSWWDKPRFFSRVNLPMDIYKQFGITGQPVVKINLSGRSLEELKTIVKTNARSDSMLIGLNEDTVKAGIIKYYKRHFDEIEPGLEIVKAESPTSNENRPDFLAIDTKGRKVIIECKESVSSEDLKQVEGYGKNKDESTRLMLIAFRFDGKCIEEAKKRNIELYECDLKIRSL